MKGSSNKERSEFEKSWQKAFDQAHMEPGSRVWENIDTSLTNAENNKFKRRIVWYKWVAAASLLIGLGLSYIAIDQVYFNNPDRLSAIENRENAAEKQGRQENAIQSDPGNGSRQEDRASEGDRRKAVAENNASSRNEAGREKAAVRENEGAPGNRDTASESRAEKSKEHVGGYGTKKQPALAKGNDTAGHEPINRSNSTGIAGNVPSETKEKEPVNKNELVPVLEKEGPQLTKQPRIENAALISITNNEENIVPGSDRAAASDVDKISGLGYDLKYQAGLYQLAQMYKVPGIKALVPDENDENKEDDSQNRFFAGVSFSSGVFDPNFNEGNTVMAEQAFINASGDQSEKIVSPFLADRFEQVASNNEKTEPAFSYAYGINVGKRLGKRWVVQGGIQYGQYSSNTSTSAYVQDRVNNKLYPLHLVANAENSYQANKRITVTRDYELQNNFEFLSIPLEAGYILVDRKVDVLVSAGVGTRIFLRNNLEDQSNLFEDVEVTPGGDSPYKNLFFNGLVSAEVSYQFASHYTLSLAPSYSMALSTFTKSETAFSSNPQSLSLSLGLRYFF